jgi:hypothetical protein
MIVKGCSEESPGDEACEEAREDRREDGFDGDVVNSFWSRGVVFLLGFFP